MATLLSFKKMLASSDDYYNSSLRAALGDDVVSNGGKNESWGGTFLTESVARIRSAKSYNSNYNAFTDFKIVSQSSIRTRIGYQVIFDPATPSGADYYTFAAASGVSRGGSPWEAKANYDGGSIPMSGVTLTQISTGAYNPSPAQFEWFTDGTDFIYYDGNARAYFSAGSEELAGQIVYFDGKGYASLLEYYDAIARFPAGSEALFGFRAWNATNLVP